MGAGRSERDGPMKHVENKMIAETEAEARKLVKAAAVLLVAVTGADDVLFIRAYKNDFLAECQHSQLAGQFSVIMDRNTREVYIDRA